MKSLRSTFVVLALLALSVSCKSAPVYPPTPSDPTYLEFYSAPPGPEVYAFLQTPHKSREDAWEAWEIWESTHEDPFYETVTTATESGGVEGRLSYLRWNPDKETQTLTTDRGSIAMHQDGYYAWYCMRVAVRNDKP